MHIVRLREEAGVHRENPLMHGENIQTPCRKAPGKIYIFSFLKLAHHELHGRSKKVYKKVETRQQKAVKVSCWMPVTFGPSGSTTLKQA